MTRHIIDRRNGDGGPEVPGLNAIRLLVKVSILTFTRTHRHTQTRDRYAFVVTRIIVLLRFQFRGLNRVLDIVSSGERAFTTSYGAYFDCNSFYCNRVEEGKKMKFQYDSYRRDQSRRKIRVIAPVNGSMSPRIESYSYFPVTE